MKRRLLLTFSLFAAATISFGQMQINNNGFENWENLGGNDEEPTDWSSLKTANTSGCGLCGLGPQVIFQEGGTVHTGSFSVKIESTSFFGTPVNGLMTCGRVRAGSTTPTNANNHNYTDTGDNQWNEAVTSRPDSVSYWVNYQPAGGDNARVSVVFHDNSNFRDPNDTASASQIGFAKYSFPATSGWERIAVPVTWDAATAPSYVLATVTSSAVAGGAQNGSVLYYDDMYLIYNVSATYATATICAGENITVNFTTSGTTTAGRTFTAELSDASGNFGSPVSIGSTSVGAGVSSGSISATIPGGTAGGAGYRIRVTGNHDGYSPVNTGSQFTINAAPAAPTVGTTATYCQGDTPSDITATGTGVLWYSDAGLTTQIGTGGTLTPGTTIGTTTYYATQTVSGCESSAGSVNITYNATPATPTVGTTATYCSGDTPADITSTGTGVLWYSDAGLTTQIGTGGTLTPGTTIGTTTYYATQTVSGCESAAGSVDITFNTTPSAPTVGTTATYCQGDTPSDITATGTGVLWYSDAGLTTQIGTGGTLTPGTTVGTTTYYATQTVSGCESTAGSVDITFNATPATPTVGTTATYCQGDTPSDITATGTGVLWYSDAGLTTQIGTGGTLTPGTTIGTTTYYATQTVSGCESAAGSVDITFTATPSTPTVGTTATYCQGDTPSDITSTGTGVLWYSDAGLTTQIGTGGTLTPGTTIGTTTYYATQTVGGCESAAGSVDVTFNATPSTPTVGSNATYCSGDTPVDLTSTGTGVLWYSDAGLTTQIGTGGTLTPGTTIGATTYYATQTVAGCESAAGSATVTFNSTPSAPTAGTDASYCTGDTPADMVATAGSGGSLTWYSDAGLTTQIGTGSTQTPGTTAGATTYYVTETASGCESSSSMVTITYNALPTAGTLTGMDVSDCLNPDGSVSLSGSTGTSFELFIAGGASTGQTNGTGNFTGLNAGDYEVVVTDGNSCSSTSNSVTVGNASAPSAPSAGADATYCEGDTPTDLSATAGAGGTLTWYLGGNVEGTGATLTPNTSAAGTLVYTVTETVTNCESAPTTVTITVNPNAVAGTANPSASTSCSSPDGQVSVSGDNGSSYELFTGAGTSVTTNTTGTFTGLDAGDYYVEVTNSCGTATTATVTVNGPAGPTAGTITPVDVTDCQTANGEVNVTGSNGTSFELFDSGNNSQATNTTGTFAGLSAGDYYVVITDGNGCSTTTSTVTVGNNTGHTVTIAPTTQQDLNINETGATITATESSTATSREWLYTTTSGSGYMSFAPTETGATYDPMFTAVGTYYVVCESVISGCTVMSSEVIIDVTDSTAAIVENTMQEIKVYSFENQVVVNMEGVNLDNPVFKLISLDGRVILNERLNNGTINQFNTYVPFGIYVFHIVANDGRADGKIMLK